MLRVAGLRHAKAGQLEGQSNETWKRTDSRYANADTPNKSDGTEIQAGSRAG